jgi:hypothetical protein
MAFTSGKMGLRIWNLVTDLYDHAQLADNWAKVDYHDHSPGRGVQIPTEGLADNSVTAAKLATALDPSGAYTTYRNYVKGMSSALWTTTSNPIFLLGSTPYGLATSDSARAAFYIDPADHAVAGRTAKMRIASHLITNAVAPANTLTIGLYPVLTFGGSSGNPPNIATVDTPVAGSTVAYITQAASTAEYQASSDFNIPSAGWYAIGFVVSANAAANSLQTVDTILQVRYV